MSRQQALSSRQKLLQIFRVEFYSNSETGDKTKVYKMMQEDRIRFFAPADYTDGSELDCLVKAIIDRTQANEKLHDIHNKMKREYLEAEKHKN